MVIILPHIVVLLTILYRIVRHPLSLNCVVALHLQHAQLLLEGKVPYIDFINLNPPLVFYWFVPQVWFSHLTGWPLPFCAAMFTWLFIVYSFIVSSAIVHPRINKDERQLIAALLFGFVLLNLFVFFHFGEREHVFILTFMPFFLMRWLRRQNAAFGIVLPVLVGGGAALTACLKPPYFFVVIAVIESYWFVTQKEIVRRLKDPEIVVCVAVVGLYVLLFWLIAPRIVLESYFLRWVPLGFAGYGAYSCASTVALLLCHASSGFMIISLWAVVVVCIGALILRRTSSLMMPLLTWTVAGYLIYLAQQRGWAYHTIVMLAGYFVLANVELFLFAQWIIQRKILVLQVLQKQLNAPVVTFCVYATLLMTLLPVLICDSFTTGKVSDPLTGLLTAYTRKHDPVLVLSTHSMPAYPCLLQIDRRPASRYLWTFPLPMYEFLKDISRQQPVISGYEEAEQRVVDEIVADTKRTRPRVIVLWPYPLLRDNQWRILPCLESKGFDQVLEHYQPMGYYNDCLVWISEPDMSFKTK